MEVGNKVSGCLEICGCELKNRHVICQEHVREFPSCGVLVCTKW